MQYATLFLKNLYFHYKFQFCNQIPVREKKRINNYPPPVTPAAKGPHWPREILALHSWHHVKNKYKM
jgi:hypothetical protein